MNLIRAALSAVLILFFLISSDRLEHLYGITGPMAYLDEGTIAVAFIGVTSYLIRRRRVEAEEQRSAIRKMNHHVRNALQSILYAEHLGSADRQKKEIAESVGRIERAVREISRENGLEMVDG